MPHFSKTRIMYYDNEQNKIKEGDYSLFQFSELRTDSSIPMLCISIPSGLHNWQTIPMNQFGLYMTFAEIQSLMFNFNSISPKNINFKMSHTIPLAKFPQAGGTTSLAFNNTLYSIIYENHDNYISVNNCLSVEILKTMHASFEGNTPADSTNKKLNFPKSNMYFNIPYDFANNTFKTNDNRTLNYNGFIDKEFYSIDPEAVGNVQGVSISKLKELFKEEKSNEVANFVDLITAYLPNILQDNDNCYVLYPGENQYSFLYKPKDHETYNMYTGVGAQNETYHDIDQRLQVGINYQHVIDPWKYLALIIFPQLSGDTSDYPSKLIEDPQGLPNIKHNYNILSCIAQEGNNPTFTDIIPKILLKGVPILDHDSNVVKHNFLETCTWSWEIDGIPTPHLEAHKLQWAITVPYFRNVYKIGLDTNNKLAKEKKLIRQHKYFTAMKPSSIVHQSI